MILIIDAVEEVMCWVNFLTDGSVEDVVVLPGALGSTEDQVYYAVKRTVNGSTVRYLEKWAKETECRGGTQNKQADCFIIGTNTPASSTISGLSHLEGEAVVAWADGIDYSPGPVGEQTTQTTYTVTGGTITLASAVTDWVVGLPYTAPWKSAKLGLQASLAESLLAEQKHLNHLGVIGAWIHPKGIRYGPDFDHLSDLPSIERGTTVPPNTVRTAYDEQTFPFPGTWDTDARLCIEGRAPRPATLLALVPDLELFH